ncbi:NVEALA domain-containing protein [uncultured Alistipes sp.]|uniref:NVEALA domain-containing protein n=1 Tax=uncultured Alistipes sp. TaxID=538949 RepID=UPI00258DA0E7|nr:NVEALA domain-containing protein [uncultured Alistipes sp.]
MCIIKKKCYFGLVAVALFAGVSTYMANRDSEMTDLMRANIEALSADEIGDGESSFIHIPCVVENNCWCIFPTIMGDGTTGMGQIYDAKKVRE